MIQNYARNLRIVLYHFFSVPMSYSAIKKSWEQDTNYFMSQSMLQTFADINLILIQKAEIFVTV